MSRNVHWWFAYTDSTAARLRALGFPQERISVVNNSIDTASSVATGPRTRTPTSGQCGSRWASQAARWRISWRRLSARRIPWLLDAGRLIRAEIPDFELLFIGAGTELGNLRAAATALPWSMSPDRSTANTRRARS